MPPLLCPSPIILDHTFPRSERDLKVAAAALGSLTDHALESKVSLVMTVTLRDFIEEMDWTSKRPALLLEIYRLLSQLFLQPNTHTIMVDVLAVTGHVPHPVPSGAIEDGRVWQWSDELGRLLKLHDKSIRGAGYFIGVACDKGFSGQDTATYHVSRYSRMFPLIGPKEIGTLEDAYEWELPDHAYQIKVSFEDVKQRYSILGAISFETPSNGSHYKVRFLNGSAWTCDRNWGREIGDNMLNQLKSYCGYPLGVIKLALTTGKLPSRRLRLLA